MDDYNIKIKMIEINNLRRRATHGSPEWQYYTNILYELNDRLKFLRLRKHSLYGTSQDIKIVLKEQNKWN